MFEVGDLIKYTDAEEPKWLAVVLGTGKFWNNEDSPMVYIHWITGTLANSEYEKTSWYPTHIFKKVSE